VWIYGDVGVESDAAQIAMQIDAMPRDKPVLVRINSYGGQVYEGLAIYTALRNHPRAITRVDGIAASAAAVIALGSKTVQIAEHAHMFFHRAYAAVVGNQNVMLSTAEWLDKIDREIIDIIKVKTGKRRDEIARMLDGDVDGTLFNAKEAFDWGLADVILKEKQEDTEPAEPDQVVQAAAPAAEVKADMPLQPEAFIPPDPPGGEGEGVEGQWENPNLSDFTDKRWDELSADERRKIARYFAFAFDLDAFEHLKLPHHFPPNHRNANKASLNGVRNALARLPQTQGISEEDRNRIEAHLRRHLPKEDSVRVEPAALIEKALLHLIQKATV